MRGALIEPAGGSRTKVAAEAGDAATTAPAKAPIRNFERIDLAPQRAIILRKAV
jgi:hypothetical protein